MYLKQVYLEIAHYFEGFVTSKRVVATIKKLFHYWKKGRRNNMKKLMFLGMVIGVVFLTQFIEQYSSRPDVLTQGTQQIVETIES